MIFNKATVSALAVFSLATTVLANPLQASAASSVSVSAVPTATATSISRPEVPTVPEASEAPVVPLSRRDDLVLSAVQGVLDNVGPLVDNLSK